MNRAHKPAAFRLDDPGIVVTPSKEPRRAAPAARAPEAGEPASETGQLPAVAAPTRRAACRGP